MTPEMHPLAMRANNDKVGPMIFHPWHCKKPLNFRFRPMD